jgi:hypothetical protein
MNRARNEAQQVAINDFVKEITAVVRNKPLTQMLDERSREPATFTLKEVRQQLQRDKRKQGKNAKRRKR